MVFAERAEHHEESINTKLGIILRNHEVITLMIKPSNTF